MAILARLLSGAVLAGWLACSASAALAGIQDFYVNNNSKWAIYYIYVSPDYEDEWEEDVLGSEVLMPGEYLEIEMIGYDDYCYFDIKIEDERGNVREYWDIDLCMVRDVDYP